MKSIARCVWCVLFSALYWALLSLAQEAVVSSTTGASVNPVENASSIHSAVEEEKVVHSTESDDLIGDIEPSVEVHASFEEKRAEEGGDDVFNKQVFVEATSQNSGVANEMTNSGPPVVVTLADVATAELQQRAAISSQDENPPATNHSEPPKPEETANNRSEPNTQQTDDKVKLSLDAPSPNLPENLTEEIPSFSEWAQKRLEEAEKKKEPQNASAHHHVNGKQGSGAKLRWKNYASLDCGAKVVASNPEAVSPSAILSPSRDEYKLNTCTSRIWFIVELCEAIQAKKIDFANFELFSSSPKDFTVSVSDRFPTREWSNVGQFTAKDERDIQSFDLHPHLFGKYIKVEVKSHYGSEHYCPISLFRVYGTSEFEVLQKEDSVHADRVEEDEDDDDESLDIDYGDSSKNLFSSATDAVISMVKKAAEVLGNKGNNSNQTESSVNLTQKYSPLVNSCSSPSHLVVCNNCSDTLFGLVYELLSCRNRQVMNLVNIPLIKKAAINSNICQRFGFDFNKITDITLNSRSTCVQSFFPEHYLGAMCNSLAIIENKVVLNVSNQYSNQTQAPVDEDNLVNIETSEPHVLPTEVSKEVEVTDALTVEVTDAVPKSTCSTDVSYTSQIKPTKTISSELDLKEMITESSSLPPQAATTTEDAIEVEEEGVEEAQPESNDPQPEAETETVAESVETLDDHLEHFISEFNGDGQGGQSTPSTTSATPQAAQKESVFLRLSNRIKALERNMSLSGQYLEELSKRYKKQVEEMQKLLDKTVLNMNEEIKKKEQRNQQLEEHLTTLTATVEALVAERNSWLSTVFSTIMSSAITLFVLSFCRRNRQVEPSASPKVEVKRRKSIDVVTHSVPQKKKRRPSDQALKIVRSSMWSEENEKMNSREKKRKKKKQPIKRSSSINTLNEEGDLNSSEDYKVFQPGVTSSQVWNRQESAPPRVNYDWVETKCVEEIPFVLEESEHSTLEPLTLPGGVKIEPPNFVKTAANARKGRVSVVANGKGGPVAKVDEGTAVNGNLSGPEEQQTPKKTKKSFKLIFKKVF